MAERMNHDKMRRASELPVTGPAATDSLAASGGLELPGRAAEAASPDQQRDLEEARGAVPPTAASVDRMEGHDPDERWRTHADGGSPNPEQPPDAASTPARSRSEDPGDVSPARLEPIPGEHDTTTAMSSQPGIVGTTGFGVDVPATDDPTVDNDAAKRTRWESGGRIPRRDTK